MTNQPIGFWLKHLDELIEDSFDHALARDGLQRRHWQTLHLLSSSSAVNETAIEEALRPFFASPGFWTSMTRPG